MEKYVEIIFYTECSVIQSQNVIYLTASYIKLMLIGDIQMKHEKAQWISPMSIILIYI